jgi:CRISPR/Cas system CSM-associated protein Csm3 (group 7 of RAMP superfamily)
MAEGFQRLDRIVCLNVTYTTNGYVSIQTGMGDGVRDNLVIREGGAETRPIIPGSTLKGAVRHLVESILARALPQGQVCVPLPCSRTERRQGRTEHVPITGRKVPCDALGSGGQPCPVCQLFGSTRQRSRITFHDAKPMVSAEELSTFNRRHVAIDRETGTQSGGALMTVEAVPGDAMTFEGLVTFINPEPWMVGAVVETLPLIRYNGVGARKSRGYGDLTVQVGAPQFVMRPASDTQSSESYLNNCLAEWRTKRQNVDLPPNYPSL